MEDRWRYDVGLDLLRSETNLIFYGTGNPGPWNPDQRPGDNKWTCRIFARAYVTAENGNEVSVVDTRDHTVVKNIEPPRVDGPAQLKPKGVVVSGDGKRVYVATGRGNSVAVINGKHLTLIPVG